MITKSSTRRLLAEETVAIVETGSYKTSTGRRVDLTEAIKAAREDTVLYAPGRLAIPNSPAGAANCAIGVTDETTCAALYRLAAKSPGHLAALNFASARNPGGGFLNGAQAQEECLARSSALYTCLLAQPEYYERNRAHPSALYLDYAIFSPRVPFFRDDDGALLEQPVLASVITAPAPNAGAIAKNSPEDIDAIPSTLKRRSRIVLAIAAQQGVTHLVLGAWGCGVFRNDPHLVAQTFAEHLQAGEFMHAFESVTFAVYDAAPGRPAYHAFAETFGA